MAALRLPPAPKTPRSTPYTSGRNRSGYKPPSRTDFHSSGLTGIPKIPALKRPSATIEAPSAGSVRAVKHPTKTELGISASQSSGSIPQISASFMKAPGSAASGMTNEQALHLAFEAQKAKESHGGFLDEVVHGAEGLGGELLAGIGNVLSRPLWGVTRGVDLATLGSHGFNLGEFAHGFGQGFTGEHPETFGALLDHRHILEGHSILRGIAGLGLDLVADPLNLVLLAAVPVTGGASGSVLSAELAADLGREGALKGLTELGEKATLRDVVARAAGYSKAYEAELKEVSPMGKSWGDLTRADLENIHPEVMADYLRMKIGSQTAAMIGKGAEKLMPHVIQPRVWVPTFMGGRSIPLLPVEVAGHRILPFAPTILNVAEGRGLLSHLPLASFMATHAADLLKPGWREPITHLAEQGRKYNIEAYRSFLTKEFHGAAIRRLTEMGLELGVESQRRALDVAEQEGSVHELRGAATDNEIEQLVRGHAARLEATPKALMPTDEANRLDELTQQPIEERQLQEDFLRDEGLDAKQIAYVKEWHGLMERQRQLEERMGVRTEGEIGGRVYVPHVQTAGEVGSFIGRAIKKGFQHARERETTLQQMERENVERELRGERAYITTPSELLEHRLMAGAHAIGWQGFRTVVGDVMGVAAHVEDAEKMAHDLAEVDRVQGELDMWKKQGELLPRDHAAIMEEVSNQANAAVEGHVETIQQTLAAIDKDIADLEGQQAEDAASREAAKSLPRPEDEQARVDKLGELRKARRVLSRAESSFARQLEAHIHQHSYGVAHYTAEEAHQNALEKASVQKITRAHRGFQKDVKRLEREERRVGGEARDALAEHGRYRQGAHEEADDVAAEIAHAFYGAKKQILDDLHAEFDKLGPQVREGGKEAPVSHLEALVQMEHRLEEERLSLQTLLKRTYGALKSGEQRATREAIRRGVERKLEEVNTRIERTRLMRDVVHQRNPEQTIGRPNPGGSLNPRTGKVSGATYKSFREAGLHNEPEWQAAVKGFKAHTLEDKRADGLLSTIQDVQRAETPEDLAAILGYDHPLYAELRAATERLAAFGASGAHQDLETLAHAAEESATRHGIIRKQLGAARGRLTRFEKKHAAEIAEAEHLPARQQARAQGKEEALRGFERSMRDLTAVRDRLAAAQGKVQVLSHELDQLGGVVKGPAPRHYERSIAARQRLRHRIVTEVAPKRLARLSRPGKRQVARTVEQLQKAASAYDEETLRREARLADAQEVAEQGRTKLNPMIGSGVDDLRRVDSVPGKAFAPEVARALGKIEDFQRDPEGWGDVLKVARQGMARWKLMVTAAGAPGYRIRNTLSDIWNAYLSGVPLRAMPLYLVKANRLMLRARQGHLDSIMQVMQMEAHGVTQGLFHGDVEEALHRFHGKGPISLVRHPIKWYVQKMTAGNRWGENMGRIAHMLYRLDHGSKNMADAAWEVRRAHFDYADLTPAEQKIKDFAVPFYTWTRKNVPYQITQTLARPARAAAFYKVAQESEYASGDTKGELIPDFFRDAGAFRVPGLGAHTYLLPQVGLIDLARVTTKSGLEGMLGPQYQALIAAVSGKNPYTGADINPATHELVPTNPLLARILSVLPGGLTGETERAVGKRQIRSAGISPMLSYLLGSTGIPYLRYAMGRNPISEAENPAENRALSTFGGLPLYSANQDEERMLAQLRDADEFKKFLRILRDNGYPEPKKRKVSPNEAVIQRAVELARSRP